MRLAVHQRHPEINQGIAGEYALGQLTANTLLHRLDELPRHGSTDHLLSEFEARPAFQRLDLHHAHRVLTMSAGLFDQSALRRYGTNKGLSERSPYRLDVDLDVPGIP